LVAEKDLLKYTVPFLAFFLHLHSHLFMLKVFTLKKKNKLLGVLKGKVMKRWTIQDVPETSDSF